MVVELGDKNVGQQAGTGHAAGNGAAGRRHLHHTLAAAAGFPGAGNLDDLQLCRDQIQHLADILAHHPQVTATIGAAAARIKLLPLARRAVRDPGAAARWTIGDLAGGSRSQGTIVLTVIHDRCPALRRGDQQILQRQFQLLDLSLDFFRGLAEDLLLQLGDAQPQCLDQLVMRAKRGRHPGILRLQGGDHRLQKGGVFGKVFGGI